MQYIESAHVELKEALTADIKKEIVAFANSNGGEIFIGIARDGQVVGVQNAEADMERISNMILNGIRPDLSSYTTVERLLEQGKSIIRICVSRGAKRPYHLSDKGLKPSGVSVRHGVIAAPASEEAIRQMIRDSDGTTFDKARSPNQELTFAYASKFFAERKVKFDANHQRSLRLIDNDMYYTNAALLLSDQCEHSIKCAVYQGIGKTDFLARKELTGSILQQMDDAYQFISLNNKQRSQFEGLRRVDLHDYPEYALREALLNCIVHRDYDYSGSILINILADRMEFLSLGGLVKGLTLADIMSGVSQSRNTVIAAVFYRLELIESYGTGIQRIIESYAGYSRQPKFSPAPSSFLVELPNINENHAIDSALADADKVLQLLAHQGEVSRRDVENLLQCSAFPATNVLNDLLRQGKIVRFGAARATRYRRSK